MRFTLLPGTFAVARLDAAAALPAWLDLSAALVALVRTAAELSLVCADAAVPAAVTAERGWRALALAGPIAFGTTGVVARFARVLADAGIGIFVLSTYDTDYLLIKAADLSRGCAALRAGGYEVDDPAAPTRR